MDICGPNEPGSGRVVDRNRSSPPRAALACGSLTGSFPEPNRPFMSCRSEKTAVQQRIEGVPTPSSIGAPPHLHVYIFTSAVKKLYVDSSQDDGGASHASSVPIPPPSWVPNPSGLICHFVDRQNPHNSNCGLLLTGWRLCTRPLKERGGQIRKTGLCSLIQKWPAGW